MNSIDKINFYLAKLGMSGAELERAIGVSGSVYSQWNTGRTAPSKRSLAKIATVLDVDVEELMADKEDAKKEPAAVVSDKLPSDFYLLSEEQQKQVTDYIAFLLSQQ